MTTSLAAVIDSRRMVLVCGSGGVGKTTVSAALGLGAASRSTRRVLVITVDPARRLADSLGIPAASFAGAGAVRVDGRGWPGELWVAMLDTKAGWDDLIRRHAPDRALAERVLANPLYHNITSRFVNSHDYLAMEQLHHLDAAGEFDLVVVDTPPSRNALDLIDAPQRMREFFASSLLRWLTVPASSRVVALATKPFTQIADRILGRRFLQDVTDFFVLLRTMEDGFVRRAAEVEALIAADTSTFVIVSTCEPAPVREAGFLATELRARNLPLGGLVLNRVLPDDIGSEIAAAAATALVAAAGDESVVGSLADGLEQPADGVRHVLATVGRRFDEVREQAAIERGRRSELAVTAAGAAVATAPAIGGDVHDLVGLERLAAHLGAPGVADGSR